MRQEDKYQRARKRVKAKKGFYSHLSAYIATGIFFFALNMLTDPFDIWWPIPMLSWGIGLVIHYLTTFGLPNLPGSRGPNILSKEWEDREMEKELRRVGYDENQEIYEEESDLEISDEDELELREIRRERRGQGLDEEDFV